MVSIATIGLYIAYALPIFFRVTLACKSFVPGPFNLGRYGVLVGWIAVIWVAVISVLFSLPVAYPVTIETLNYTPVAVGGLFILIVSSWILRARHWFRGPITNIDTWSSERVQLLEYGTTFFFFFPLHNFRFFPYSDGLNYVNNYMYVFLMFQNLRCSLAIARALEILILNHMQLFWCCWVLHFKCKFNNRCTNHNHHSRNRW